MRKAFEDVSRIWHNKDRFMPAYGAGDEFAEAALLCRTVKNVMADAVVRATTGHNNGLGRAGNK